MRQTQLEHRNYIEDVLYHQPITTRVKNGLIEIPQSFLQRIPADGQCDIEMVSDNVMVIVFNELDNCFTKLRSIEYLLVCTLRTMIFVGRFALRLRSDPLRHSGQVLLCYG